jgi:transcriptional regulator with XRE-family HTH domain
MSTEPGFGIWLMQRRKELGLTRKELASGVGCSPVTIYKIESGQRRPSRQIADLLAEFLGVPSDELPLFARFATSVVGQGGSPVDYRQGGGRAPWLALHGGRTNLPAPATPFIGREEQVAQVQALLENPSVRLVTLTGPPGVGKTRLGLRVAACVVDKFADGVFFVQLANVKERELILSEVAQPLGVKESGSAPLLEELKQYLRNKQLLLVMDNFEHLVSNASLVADLLLSVPLLKVLVTSREVLHIYGEHLFDVPPLSLPDVDRLSPLEDLPRYEAVCLFIERTAQTSLNRNFALTEENASSVVEICARLDGLPWQSNWRLLVSKIWGLPRRYYPGYRTSLTF